MKRWQDGRTAGGQGSWRSGGPPGRRSIWPSGRPFSGLHVLAGLSVACGPGRATVPPDEPLPFASDTIRTGWSELPLAAATGARWVVVAADWDSAAFTDFGAGKLAALKGSKPGVYVHPFQVFSFRDTVYLADWGRRRTTAWSPEGALLDSIPAADRLRGLYPRARDGAGNLYYQVDPRPGPDGSGNQDSAAVVRAAPDQTRFDTVARLTPLELAQVRRENQTRFERKVFSGADLWGVWPDGTVWIARRFRNQLEIVNPQGKVARGPELPDPVYEITGPDRMEYLQGYPAEVRPKEMDIPWAIIHPPFYAAFTAPDGTVWLEKSKPAADSLRRIHVLDRSGGLRRVLVLKGQGRLLAVGAEYLLLAERAPDGLRLLRVRIPAPVPRPTP
jgi:hypothetical protein